MKGIGTLQTNKAAIAVVEIPEQEMFDPGSCKYLPVFESLQDPGNMGTILRTCDWYGIDRIILSPDSVDLYNTKVIQASMGSFTRVHVFYMDLFSLINDTDITVLGTATEGKSVYNFDWPDRAILLFGNESKGLSAMLGPVIDEYISIPRFGGAESLNVSMATGIILDNIRRGRMKSN